MASKRPDAAGDRPVQSRDSPKVRPGRQIAQDPQQSTGVSTGQS